MSITYTIISIYLPKLNFLLTDWRYVFVADLPAGLTATGSQAGFEALSCQVTHRFIKCRNAEIRTDSAIKYSAC
ncbi:MAG: hypothetical protein PHR81_00965 [Bacteroidales bacterium]|jgi:hypothetical protein|nr:hypothetical protein [Bacteroidales bacterium]MDD4213360.1 hypothetical protein [Bacteroidales bacterium]